MGLIIPLKALQKTCRTRQNHIKFRNDDDDDDDDDDNDPGEFECILDFKQSHEKSSNSYKLLNKKIFSSINLGTNQG